MPTPIDHVSRRTGIRVAAEMPWGAHLCVFYETPEDLLDTCVAYFDAGLSSRELCVWAISEPISESDAVSALRRSVPDFDQHLAAGDIELLRGRDWYLRGDEFDLQRITSGWAEKLTRALQRGYAGMRISGNAFWIETDHWEQFCEYEHALSSALADQKIIGLCTYPLQTTRAIDLLDVARAHQCTIARRHGDWDFLETAELRQAKYEIARLNDALDVLTRALPGHDSLTARERAVLTHVVKGSPSKEIARALGIGLRTVEFHRTNIMRKLGAKGAVDLVRRVLDR